jgi:hypothetical protein
VVRRYYQSKSNSDKGVPAQEPHGPAVEELPAGGSSPFLGSWEAGHSQVRDFATGDLGYRELSASVPTRPAGYTGDGSRAALWNTTSCLTVAPLTHPGGC